ncbi:hypothetical protein [Lentzea alba]|uniref:hypothetical protein n=1 Tax=Lentzea alba TaxID=2714351 RepID=UPI001F5E4520|nr:hypothetical protein [Lentzea alba]
MRSFTRNGDTLALEAAAAVRSASQAVDRLRGHGAGAARADAVSARERSTFSCG